MEKKRCGVDRSRRMLNDACVTVEREKERRTSDKDNDRTRKEDVRTGKRINARVTKITRDGIGAGREREMYIYIYIHATMETVVEGETVYNAGRRSQSGRNAITLTRNPITYSFA